MRIYSSHLLRLRLCRFFLDINTSIEINISTRNNASQSGYLCTLLMTNMLSQKLFETIVLSVVLVNQPHVPTNRHQWTDLLNQFKQGRSGHAIVRFRIGEDRFYSQTIKTEELAYNKIEEIVNLFNIGDIELYRDVLEIAFIHLN